MPYATGLPRAGCLCWEHRALGALAGGGVRKAPFAPGSFGVFHVLVSRGCFVVVPFAMASVGCFNSGVIVECFFCVLSFHVGACRKGSRRTNVILVLNHSCLPIVVAGASARALGNGGLVLPFAGTCCAAQELALCVGQEGCWPCPTES